MSARPNGQEGRGGLPYLHLETENMANDEMVGIFGRFSILKSLCRAAGMLQFRMVPPWSVEARTFDHIDMLYQIISGLCKKCTYFCNTLYAQECRMICITEK